MRGIVIALVMVAVLLMAGVGAVQSGFQASVSDGPTAQRFNETVTVSTSGVVSLNESQQNVTYVAESDVTVSLNGTTVEPDDNWSWNRNNGTIEFQSGDAFSGGETVAVRYGYGTATSEQAAARELGLVLVNDLGQLLPFLGGVALLLAAVASLRRVN